MAANARRQSRERLSACQARAARHWVFGQMLGATTLSSAASSARLVSQSAGGGLEAVRSPAVLAAPAAADGAPAACQAHAQTSKGSRQAHDRLGWRLAWWLKGPPQRAALLLECGQEGVAVMVVLGGLDA